MVKMKTLKSILKGTDASFIPVLEFVGAVMFGGFALWIGTQIFDGLSSIYPTQVWWQIISAMISGFPFIIVLGAGAWLIFQMQKRNYFEVR